MIIKYPILLIALIPLWALFFGSRPVLHTIRFPKTKWMAQLESKSTVRQLWLVRWLERLILTLIVLAVAQPQWVEANKKSVTQGIDIMVLLDTSGSMNAEDFEPKNRMSVAKETLSKFIKKRSNDRIGLIIFGTDAITAAPITFDHSILRKQLENVSVGDAGDGTAIGLAIATGIQRLKGSDSKTKIMILITDGVNNVGQIDPISAANLAEKNNIKTYTIGIGDKKGAPIPVHHPTYGKIYARHPNGQIILTEFDEDTLKQIATITNGAYFNATNTDELLAGYKQIDSLEKTEIQTSINRQVTDLFPVLIGCILGLLILKEVILIGRLIGVRT